jgi:4-methylaminobutanoate oxidase (formaldehyde-forming)
MRVDDLVGALWLPGDGKVDPAGVTMSLAKGARRLGVTIVEGVRVTGSSVAERERGRRVTGVVTDSGEVEAHVVVNAAGQWAKALGDLVGVTVPLHSAEHFYVVTEEIEGTHPDLPIMRDPDGWTYFKEEVGGLVVGGFEPEAKPWVAPDEIPYPFEFALLPEDWEHFSVLMESALQRIPSLEHTGIRKFYNGPESFTPDNQFLLGEAPELGGFYVAAGFNSVGIASAGGAGKALAEWIVGGEPPMDLVAVDIRRFGPLQGDNAWLRSRVSEVLGIHYAMPWPNRELTSARDQRRSPVHEQTAAAGAVFGSRNGWERPLFFGDGDDLDHGWGIPAWQRHCDEEQRACRQAVAVFDQTSFSKYDIRGPGALAGLQHVCAADVDVAHGACVYTPWLNSRAGYEADVTVTRLADDAFRVVSSAATTVRDLDWLHRHLPTDATVTDRSEDFAVLGVMGPRSRDVLTSLGGTGLDDADFPFATSRSLELAGIEVAATRMTYVGELGWEVLVPWEDAPVLHEQLLANARRLGGGPAGYSAIESLRLEKGYRAFGRDLTPDLTPAEAGLVFATAIEGDKDFLGRAALVAHRRELADGGPRRRIASLVLEDPSVMLWGGELVLRDGEPGGQVTSAAYGATVGAAVGLALLRAPGPVTQSWLDGARYEVDVAGTLVPARVTLRAPLT